MRSALAGLAAILWPSAASAATPSEPGELELLRLFFGADAVVAVPAARPEPRAQATASLFVVTSEEIRARGYRDLADLLHDLPGVDFSGFVSGELASVVLFRGIEANNNKILVLRDGVPISFPAGTPFKFGRNVPLYDVERIEVLYGPASVVYGAEAFSAVIELISQEAAERPRLEAAVASGSLDPLRGFDRYAFDAHLALRQAVGPVVATASVRTYQSNGPDLAELFPGDFAALDALPPPLAGRYETPIRAWHAEGALTWARLQLGARFTDHAWSTTSGLSTAPPVSNLPTADAVWRYRFLQAFARHGARMGPLDLQTIVTYSSYRTAPETAFFNFGAVHFKLAQQESLRLDHRATWELVPALALSGGLRAQTFNVVPRSDDLDRPAQLSGDSLRELGLDHLVFERYGLFGFADYRPLPPLKLTAGVSYEHDGNVDEDVALVRGGAVARLFGDRAHVKALFGQGFAPAAPDRQFQRFTIPGEFIFLPNPDLRSERIRSVELVYDHQLHPTLRIDLAAFRNDVSDLQQVVPVGPVTVDGVSFPAADTFANLSSVRTWGGEASLRCAPRPFVQGFASYALLWGRESLPDAGGGEQTFDEAKIPRHKALAGVMVRLRRRYVADVRLRWISDVPTRASNELFMGRSIDGYHDLNLNLRAERLLPGLDAELHVENLTDRRTHHFGVATESGASGLPQTPQPGLRFLLGLTLRLEDGDARP